MINRAVRARLVDDGPDQHYRLWILSPENASPVTEKWLKSTICGSTVMRFQ